MSQIQLPIKLSDQVSATLVLKLQVGRDMRNHAAANGVGPEELENLVRQKIQEVATLTAAALEIEWDADGC